MFCPGLWNKLNLQQLLLEQREELGQLPGLQGSQFTPHPFFD